MEEKIMQMEADAFMPTYGRFPVQLEWGNGATLYDEANRPYIDFASGIGVNCLGYGDTEWVTAVTRQAAQMQHGSNLYYTPVSVKLGRSLCEKSGFQKVFLCNSGAEANECAIKIARKYGTDHYGERRNQIVTLMNSFHGRTVTTLAATGQDGFHTHFTPFTEGFRYAQANNLEALAAQIDDTVCGVMMELIQGEGGVLVADPEYVKAVRALCDEKDLILIFDEVQTGVGRTGKFYAWETIGAKPDVLTSAKGLGNGLPMGACLADEKCGTVLGPGDHGSTFGGNPVACAGAQVVLNRMSDAFLQSVAEKGDYLKQQLEALPQITQVRGKGLMLGAALQEGIPAKAVAAWCAENGLLVLTAKEVLRFLPPLVISKEEIDRGVAILKKGLEQEEQQ